MKSRGSPQGRGLASRPYQTEEDLQRMQDLLMEARSRTSDWRYPHVGDLMWAFLMVTCHLTPQEQVRLWHDRHDRLIAYAMLGEDPSFDVQVLPEYEGSGIEAEALGWAESRLSALRRREGQTWNVGLVAGAREDDPGRIAFLEQHGFRYSGTFAEINMLRSLAEAIPEPALPAGYQVRAVAGADEVPARAAAQRAVWQPWSVGDVTNEDYARLMQMPGYHRDLDIVAVTADGIVAAYVNGWTDPVNGIGCFGPVGTLPGQRRQGLSRGALLEGLRRMRAHGMDRVCISTGVSNAPAMWLYASLGFRAVSRYLDYVKESSS